MRLNLIIFAISFNHIYTSSSKVFRVECVGGFVVCGFPHIMHSSCYDRWHKGCPLCAREVKDPVQEVYTDTIYLDQNQGNDCAICTVGCHEKPDIYLTGSHLVPTAPPLEMYAPAVLSTVAPVLRKPDVFYDQYQALQRKISKTKSAEARAALILRTKLMLADQFRYPKK